MFQKCLQRFHRARRAWPRCRPSPSCPSNWSAPPTRFINLLPYSSRSPPNWQHCPRGRTKASKGRLPTREPTAQVRFKKVSQAVVDITVWIKIKSQLSSCTQPLSMWASWCLSELLGKKAAAWEQKGTPVLKESSQVCVNFKGVILQLPSFVSGWLVFSLFPLAFNYWDLTTSTAKMPKDVFRKTHSFINVRSFIFHQPPKFWGLYITFIWREAVMWSCLKEGQSCSSADI